MPKLGFRMTACTSIASIQAPHLTRLRCPQGSPGVALPLPARPHRMTSLSSHSFRSSLRRLTRQAGLILGLALAGSHPLLAAPSASTASHSTEQVTVTLLPSHSQVPPGGTVQVGIRQVLAPHWHTYWVNPGDSGMATRVQWHLPEGWRAGDIQWPVPERIDVGPIANHGYEREVTLLVDVAVPQDATAGQTAELKADVNWLVCQEVCIPQQASLSVPVTVGRDAVVVDANREALASAQRTLPRHADDAPTEVLHTPKGLLIGLPGQPSNGQSVHFFADAWGVTQHNAKPAVHQAQGRWWLLVPHGDDARQVGGQVTGVLRIGEVGTQVRATLGAAPQSWQAALPWAQTDPEAADAKPAHPDAPAAAVDFDIASFLTAIGLAFLGGVVLNLMPCVFPVLSIKALSLLQHPDRNRSQRIAHGSAYTLGVVLSFVALAALLLALQATGREIGWGFQFQQPAFVLLLGGLLFAVGLNLLGVFEVGQGLAGIGGQLAEKEGLAGSFFTGVLATVVATPCTAPFMASAVGYALTQPAAVVLAVFTSLGLGLAAPYLLLSSWPALQRRLPRPGPWMLRFKQALAFPMFASVVWLVWVLAQQTGPDGVAVALGALLAIGLAGWVLGTAQFSGGSSGGHWPRIGRGLAALIVLATIGLGAWSLPEVGNGGAASASATRDGGGDTAWEPFSQARLDALRAEGKPVFVNFTAAWCITCLVNERTALGQDRVLSTFKSQGITYLKGDWTHQNPEITRVLSQHGRSGVPLYLFFGAGQGTTTTVLPQVLTPDVVIQAVSSRPLKAASLP